MNTGTNILQAFAAAVASFADRPAVRVEQTCVTYAELDALSDEIAVRVSRSVEGSARGRTVGLLVARTHHLIPSLVGILKAGAAYIPIDPWLPAERVEAMLTDARSAVIVSDGTFEVAEWAARRSIPVVDPKHLRADDADSDRIPVEVVPDDTAYVIFTSGSTGRPKGVVVSHRNLAVFVSGWSDVIPFAGRRSIAALATIGFDIFLAETLVPLLNGVEVVLASDEDVASPRALINFLQREECDMIQATPSRMRWMFSIDDPRVTLAAARVLIVGGERLPEDLADSIFRHSRARLFNAYGPTETTVWTSAAEIRPGDGITIGPPIPGAVYQVDRLATSSGEPGELLILGSMVADYLKPYPRTSGGFFTSADGVPGFRTGDRVLGDDTSRLKVLGRVDEQVKVDGYRVELGEIETVALRIDGVKAAHACLVGSEDRRTIALVFDGDGVTVGQVRKCLAERLPRYMIPTTVIPGRVELSTAGKAVRKAVEEVAVAALRATRHQLTPEFMVSEYLDQFAGSEPVPGAGILGRLGLGSLACVRLLAQLEVTFGCRIELVRLLAAETMADIDRLVSAVSSAPGCGWRGRRP